MIIPILIFLGIFLYYGFTIKRDTVLERSQKLLKDYNRKAYRFKLEAIKVLNINDSSYTSEFVKNNDISSLRRKYDYLASLIEMGKCESYSTLEELNTAFDKVEDLHAQMFQAKSKYDRYKAENPFWFGED